MVTLDRWKRHFQEKSYIENYFYLLKSTKSAKATSQKFCRNIVWANFFGCPYHTNSIKTCLGLPLVCKTYLIIILYSHDKGKDAVAVFVDFLFDHFSDSGAVHIIWSDGPSSEFKNKLMVNFLQSHSQKHKPAFLWKYFATSHGKGVVDGIGGKAKTLVWAKVMSKGMTELVIKWFSKAAEQLLNKTEVIHTSQEEISSKISVIDWSLIKSQWLGVGKNNIHIVTSNNGNTVQAFWWWKSGRILQDRWKHKVGNRWMYSFHCYPFDFIFSWHFWCSFRFVF